MDVGSREKGSLILSFIVMLRNSMQHQPQLAYPKVKAHWSMTAAITSIKDDYIAGIG